MSALSKLNEIGTNITALAAGWEAGQILSEEYPDRFTGDVYFNGDANGKGTGTGRFNFGNDGRETERSERETPEEEKSGVKGALRGMALVLGGKHASEAQQIVENEQQEKTVEKEQQPEQNNIFIAMLNKMGKGK